jgi:hypothetical protein
VGKVGICHVAERVIANVLNHAASIGVGPGFFELGGSQAGIAAEQKRDDGVVPGQVNELLVSQQGIGVGTPLAGHHKQQYEREDCRDPGEAHSPTMLAESNQDN